MWLEAIFTRDDLRDVAERFSPLKILLGVSGNMLLVAPRDLSLIPGTGHRGHVRRDGALAGPRARRPGLDARAPRERPADHRGARPAGPHLVFRLQIDHTGVAILPSFFDHTVTARINQELERKQVELAWNFSDTLSHVFSLPPTIASAAALGLRATAGRVKVTESALGLAVDFEADVQARAPRSTRPVARALPLAENRKESR